LQTSRHEEQLSVQKLEDMAAEERLLEACARESHKSSELADVAEVQALFASELRDAESQAAELLKETEHDWECRYELATEGDEQTKLRLAIAEATISETVEWKGRMLSEIQTARRQEKQLRGVLLTTEAECKAAIEASIAGSKLSQEAASARWHLEAAEARAHHWEEEALSAVTRKTEQASRDASQESAKEAEKTKKMMLQLHQLRGELL